MKSLCVFCGSRAGNEDQFRQDAARLGRMIAERGFRLVYGGGSVGLMGILADAALAAGGNVIGVIPEFLAVREVMHSGLADLRIVPSMHARKSLMADLSDGFIALPGGYGTLEELFEVITWSQLGLHRKPVGILNTAGYYDPLLHWIDASIQRDFLREEHRHFLVSHEDCSSLLDLLEKHQPPTVAKWLPTGGE
ncbi:MAG: TIGR00730 family Rossman fold protein [Planctomycetales bacterium]